MCINVFLFLSLSLFLPLIVDIYIYVFLSLSRHINVFLTRCMFVFISLSRYTFMNLSRYLSIYIFVFISLSISIELVTPIPEALTRTPKTQTEIFNEKNFLLKKHYSDSDIALTFFSLIIKISSCCDDQQYFGYETHVHTFSGLFIYSSCL